MLEAHENGEMLAVIWL